MLDGGVEMDETCIGQRRHTNTQLAPKLRWLFGFYCRQSKIPIVMYITDKSHRQLSSLVKTYIKPGSTVYSDCHASYLNLHRSKSKLTYYGYYHFWINHSASYVHEKYPFVHTMNIERTWKQLKQMFHALKWAHSPKVIDEYAQAYTFREIVKKDRAYDCVFKAMGHYYKHKYAEWLHL